MRKLIAFDDETLAALVLLGRDRMATLQDLADEAFADLLKKHHRPVDLRAALKASARPAPTVPPPEASTRRKIGRKTRPRGRG